MEARFALTDRAPSGDVVFIDIDARSLAGVGVWPWPRSIHGQLLDELLAAGAYEVVFDIDFSTSSSATEDASFARSLQNAGGYAYLGSFRQGGVGGTEIVNRPIPEFAQHAGQVLVNVDPLESGLVRAVPARDEGIGVEAAALVLTPETVSEDAIRIDYGIDLQRIVRIAAIDILDGTFDPSLVRDRQIVIGASAIELHDLFGVPRFGTVPGPMVQIAAAETVKLDRVLSNLGTWPAIVLVMALAVGLALIRGMSVVRLALGLLGIGLLVEALALAGLMAFKIEVATVPAHIGCLALLVLRLIEELALRHKQLQEHRSRLAFLANHDVRTGAMSRTAWIEHLDAAAIAQDAPVWIIIIRIDRLNTAVASLGYQITEAAIAMVHERLVAATPGKVARIETDMFAASWPYLPPDGEIQRLLAQIERPYQIGAHRMALKAHWGGSGPIDRIMGAENGLQQARMALTTSNQMGRSGDHFEPSFEHTLQYRQLVDIGVWHAVAGDELDIAFQAQVDMRTGSTIGVEALLRWHSKTLGRVSPADFIPVAEENGAIVKLGTWIFREACRRAVAQNWPGRLSINVSPVQFQQDDVVAMIRAALDFSGFPADRLDVEITESVLVDGGNKILPALQAIRAMGARIAIDDFGTGYSSLSYLSQLPVDKLKIDQSFVRAIGEPRGAGVLEAIVALGQRLDLQIVVEGVETAEQFYQLTALGCDIAQGYLFGRPGNLPELQNVRAA